jgi:hypothetical protein
MWSVTFTRRPLYSRGPWEKPPVPIGKEVLWASDTRTRVCVNTREVFLQDRKDFHKMFVTLICLCISGDIKSLNK